MGFRGLCPRTPAKSFGRAWGKVRDIIRFFAQRTGKAGADGGRIEYYSLSIKLYYGFLLTVHNMYGKIQMGELLIRYIF